MRWMCGVPKDDCNGSVKSVSFGLDPRKAGIKTHSSSGEAFDCHAHYLVSKGYERLAAREFRAPDGSGIRVLTKRSRFGAPLRPGKTGEGSNTATRSMPRHRTGGNIVVM